MPVRYRAGQGRGRARLCRRLAESSASRRGRDDSPRLNAGSFNVRQLNINGRIEIRRPRFWIARQALIENLLVRSPIRRFHRVSVIMVYRYNSAVTRREQLKTNLMKEKLLAGQPAFGVSMIIPSPQLVEMIAELGFDWVLLDCEHGTLSIESVELLCMAADANGITPIARPAVNAPEAIAPLLDRGAMGVQVPHVNSGEDARRAVEAVKFYPQGKRGMAAGTRPSRYGLSGSVADYAEQSNRETLVCVQLEDFEAIENADEILRVEGIDVFFIGPSDLSQSMGFVGRPDAPEVKLVIDATLGKIVTAGKTPGMPGKIETVAKIQEQGVLYIYTHIPMLLSKASRDFFTAVNA